MSAATKNVTFGSGSREVALNKAAKWYPSEEDAAPKKVGFSRSRSFATAVLAGNGREFEARDMAAAVAWRNFGILEVLSFRKRREIVLEEFLNAPPLLSSEPRNLPILANLQTVCGANSENNC